MRHSGVGRTGTGEGGRQAGQLFRRLVSAEFDVALRMVFEECTAAEHLRAHIGGWLQETEGQNSLIAVTRRPAEKEKRNRK